MDKSVKRDIEKRYKNIIVEDNNGQTDTFLCQECNNIIRTKVTDSGLVPMGIECPFCGKEAYHQDEDNPKIDITYEWYRPSLEEVLRMAEEKRLFSVSMILSGGLMRRKL